MASSSDRKLNSSASRASKPTFRRAGGRSGAPSQPQRKSVMPSKPAGSVRPAKRSTAGSQLGGRPAAKNVARPVARPSVTPKPAMGAIPSRPIASPKPSLGAKVTRPGRAPENTSLFNVNPDQITEGLKQNPWVSGVDVQRQFPHTLIITPTERKVIAIAYISSDDLAWAIGDDDTWIAPLSTSVDVDDQGNVITTGEGANTLNGIDAALALAKHYGAVLLTDVSADVAPVSGQAVNSKAVKAGLDYVRGFSSEFLGQVKDISTPSVEAISANLDNGIEVSLGDSDDIAKKERIVTKLLSQVEGVTYINVRSPGNYTFRNAPTS